jgi:hypothetical protein
MDIVLEQRENAELLLAQINNCLKIRNKIHQVKEKVSRSFFPYSASLFFHLTDEMN